VGKEGGRGLEVRGDWRMFEIVFAEGRRWS